MIPRELFESRPMRYFINEAATAASGRNNIESDEDIPKGFHEISKTDFEAFQASLQISFEANQKRRSEEYLTDKLERLVATGLPEAAARILLGVETT